MKTIILTHRGLDPSKSPYFKESSAESFRDQLERGYGLEFDIQFTKENEIIILHDSTLTRISEGKSSDKISDVSLKEIRILETTTSHFITLPEIINLISATKPGVIHALHLKSHLQDQGHLDLLMKGLENLTPQSYFIFDLKPEAAKYIKGKWSHVSTGASVAHLYDKERYGTAVGNTLLTVDELITHRSLYSWAWLDEWDKTDRNGGKKKLYTSDIFIKLRDSGFKIAVISPELHATSPSLLGGEDHQDAQNLPILFERMTEILALKPDVLCTDYPDQAKDLVYTTDNV